MARTPKNFVSAEQINNSIETIYTQATGTRGIIRRFVCCNTTANAPTLTVHIVPSGDANGTDTQLYTELAFSAKETQFLELEGCVLETGDSIQCVSSAANEITVRVDGTEVV